MLPVGGQPKILRVEAWKQFENLETIIRKTGEAPRVKETQRSKKNCSNECSLKQCNKPSIGSPWDEHCLCYYIPFPCQEWWFPVMTI